MFFLPPPHLTRMSSSLMRNLNCIAAQHQHYGSIDTIASVGSSSGGGGQPPMKQKSKKRLNLFKKIRKLRKQLTSIKEKEGEEEEDEVEYAIAYESCPEDQSLNERTRLIKKSNRRIRRHSTTTLDDHNRVSAVVPKPPKRNVTTIEELLAYKSTPMPNDGSSSSKKAKKAKSKSKKKKSGFLKRTGKFIVRTCRLMTYSTPYGMPGHLPPDVYDPESGRPARDYRFYDFEKGEYDYGYTDGYMGYASTYTPSVFF